MTVWALFVRVTVCVCEHSGLLDPTATGEVFAVVSWIVCEVLNGHVHVQFFPATIEDEVWAWKLHVTVTDVVDVVGGFGEYDTSIPSCIFSAAP